MGKLVIIDECITPRKFMYLYYEGPDPVAYLKHMMDVCRFHFEVSTTKVWHDRFMWDYTSDPIHFYDIWTVHKDLSRFTTMHVHIRTMGYKSKTKNEGNFTMELNGWLEHKFEPSNWLLKYTWILYSHLFYNKWRRQHIAICRDLIERFAELMKERYNLKSAKGLKTPEL